METINNLLKEYKPYIEYVILLVIVGIGCKLYGIDPLIGTVAFFCGIGLRNLYSTKK